ncbi:hypothetical protein LCGC14_1143630 [marine sediment metagenome]|uniref:Capsid protein n=1 Tax=marine sediment metagenome TaxID=412755 RepID=A0A0F9MKL9_9ZZZZ
MANVNIDPIVVRLFKQQVKLDYQSSGSQLAQTGLLRTDVEGETIQYPKLGSLISNEVGFSKAVDPQDPGSSAVIGTMAKFNASVTVDPVQEKFLNVQIRRDYSRLLTMADNRRMDQVFIDTLKASTPSITIPEGGTNLTYDKLLQVVQAFDELEVPEEDRTIVVTPKTQRALMNDPKFINNEFINKGPVATGKINRFQVLGMTMISIGIRKEGGLPKAGNIVDCFAYAKNAMGFGIGIPANVHMSIEPTLSMAILLQSNMSLNATAIDEVGIIKIEADDTKT